MREIEFDESQLPDLQSLGAALFEDPADPRSRSYARVLIRPSVSWLRIALGALLLAAVPAGAYLLLRAISPVRPLALPLALGVGLLCLLLDAKRILLCAIRVYQRYAPDSLRNKCRFEPSCSQYMVLAIQRYGLFKGLRMGVDRLRRCNVRGGGFDEP